MIASGIGMIALSGAGPVIFGGEGALPNFWKYPPRVPHGIGARLLLALLAFHAGAAAWPYVVRSLIGELLETASLNTAAAVAETLRLRLLRIAKAWNNGMFEFFRVMHIVGVAMFFGSVLAHVTAGLIPGAAENPAIMLAARQAITLANWYVTIPGLILAIASGALMVANAGYIKRRALVMHIAAAAAIAAIVLIPASLELQAAAKAVGGGTMTPKAFADAATSEHLFGTINIVLALAAIALGAALPSLRKSQS